MIDAQLHLPSPVAVVAHGEQRIERQLALHIEEPLLRILIRQRDRILIEVKAEQITLIKAVQDEFSHHVEKSRHVVVGALTQELKVLIPDRSAQSRVVEKFADLIKHAMSSMGEFQRVSFEKQAELALHKVETKVAGAVNEVSCSVSDVKSQVDSLAANVPISEQGERLAPPRVGRQLMPPDGSADS